MRGEVLHSRWWRLAIQNPMKESPTATTVVSRDAKNDSVAPVFPSHVSRVIDVLRFPLIALVVFFHAFTCTVTLPAGAYDWHQPVTDFVYWKLLHDSVATAAVPLFFALSGYLYFAGAAGFGWAVWRKKTVARVCRLWIPLVTWAGLALLFYAVLHVCGGQNETAKDLFGRPHPVWWWVDAFVGVGSVPGPYLCRAGWFVRDLFFAGLLSPLWHFLLKRKSTTWPTLGALFILYLTVFAPLPFLGSRAVFFFCLGASYAIHGRDFTADAERAAVASAVLWLAGFVALRVHEIPFLPRVMPMLVMPVLVALASRGVRAGWARPVPWLAASAFFVYFCHESLWLKVPLHFAMTRVAIPYGDWACLGFILANWALETGLCVGAFLLLRRVAPWSLVALAGIRGRKAR